MDIAKWLQGQLAVLFLDKISFAEHSMVCYSSHENFPIRFVGPHRRNKREQGSK
jgi:hypothetical protein